MRRNTFMDAFELDPFSQQMVPFEDFSKTVMPARKITKPENVAVKIDETNNSVQITYKEQSENGFYQLSETKSLPKYIKAGNLYKKIECKLVDGQVKVVLPKEGEQ